MPEELVLGLPLGEVERVCEAYPLRNRLIDERIERGRAGDLEHRVGFVTIGTNMTRVKRLALHGHDVRLAA
jgi:hypothetical protein